MILVGTNPELFPSPENSGQPYLDKTAPEIRLTGAKLLRKSARSNEFYNPDHVRTSVTDSLIDFAFLNNPPTVTASTYALVQGV